MNSNGAVVSHDRYLRFNEKDGIIGGNYTCTAQNSLGSDSFSILVRVRSKFYLHCRCSIKFDFSHCISKLFL